MKKHLALLSFILLPFFAFNQALSLRCNTSITANGCNLVSNNNFANTSSNSSLESDPFGQQMVSKWVASHGSPQLDTYLSNYVPPPTGNMQAFMFAARNQFLSAPSSGEGIAQKIPALTQGNKYVFSIFIRLADLDGVTNTMDRLNVVLTNCSSAGTLFNYNTLGSETDLPNFTGIDHQRIVCRNNIQNTSWVQLVVSFTANSAYNMIMIYPEMLLNGNNSYVTSVLAVAYPELVDITSFSAGTAPQGSNCTVTLGTSQNVCTVSNAVFTWTTPSGSQSTSSSYQQLLATQTAGGTYTVDMTVPNSISATADCSTPGNFKIESSVTLPQNCNCSSTLAISSASAQYFRFDPAFPDDTELDLYTHTFNTDACNINNLCYNTDEYFKITLSSNQSSGNQWSFHADDYNIFKHQPTPFISYQSGSSTSQNITVLIVIDEFMTGIFTVKLYNSVTNEIRELKIRSISEPRVSHYYRNSLLNPPMWQFSPVSGSYPLFTYAWQFPTGMQAVNPNVLDVVFTNQNYTGSYPAYATLTVSHPYCPSYDLDYEIFPETPRPASVAPPLLGDIKGGLSVSPVPTTGQLSIQSRKPVARVTLLGTNGQQVLVNEGNSRSVNLQSLAPGFYILRVQYADGTQETRRVVKQ